MGTIKFEIDLPNFEKELTINLTIRKDGGEVLFNGSTSSSNTNNIQIVNGRSEIKKEDEISNTLSNNVNFGEGIKNNENIVENSKSSLNDLPSKKVKKSTNLVKGGNMMNIDF